MDKWRERERERGEMITIDDRLTGKYMGNTYIGIQINALVIYIYEWIYR